MFLFLAYYDLTILNKGENWLYGGSTYIIQHLFKLSMHCLSLCHWENKKLMSTLEITKHGIYLHQNKGHSWINGTCRYTCKSLKMWKQPNYRHFKFIVQSNLNIINLTTCKHTFKTTCIRIKFIRHQYILHKGIYFSLSLSLSHPCRLN